MTPEQRAIRKAAVFHVIYGEYLFLTEDQAALWRTMAVEYINGQRDLRDMPLSAQGLVEAPQSGCACRGDCIMEHSSHPDEMALCPYYRP